MTTPIPLYVLTGYLGSGKTTLLNHLLAQPALATRRVALVINEFGTLGVDGQLVRQTDGGVFELNSGSLFCACTRSGLVKILQQICDEVRPEMVIAEATGVSETSDLYDLLETEPLTGRFQIRANVCVVDAFNFTKILPYLNAARTQVATADGIVVNKTELLDETGIGRLTALLEELNPRAELATVSRGELAWDFVERLRHGGYRATAISEPPGDIVTCSFSNRRAVREKLAAAVEALGENLLRLKGIVDFGAGPCLVESVFGTLTERPVELASTRPGTTALGWKIEADALSRTLAEAFVPDAESLVSLAIK